MGKGRKTMGVIGRRIGLVCVAASAIFGLSACAEPRLDNGLWGAIVGDDGATSDKASPIRAMKEDRTAYPTLGSVPPRPTDLTTEAQRQTKMDALANDRAASRKRKADTEAIPMPTPLEVPNKPNIVPGKS